MSEAPEIISQSKLEETDYSAWKIVVLALISIASSMVMVFEFSQFLVTLQYPFLWFGIAAMLTFVVVNVLNAFTIKHFLILIGIGLVECMLPFVLFMQDAKGETMIILLSALGIMALWTLGGMRRGINVLRNSIKIEFFAITRVMIPKIVTGVLVVICAIMYLQYFAWGRFSSNMAHTIVNESLNASLPVTQMWFPKISFDVPVTQFFKDLTLLQIDRLPPEGVPGIPFDIKASLAKLSAADREVVINKLSDELMKRTEEKVGAFKPKETVRDAIYRLLDSFVKSASATTQKIGAIVMAALIFFSLKGFVALFYWLINIIAFIMYKFMIAADFALVSYESRSREFVILP